MKMIIIIWENNFVYCFPKTKSFGAALPYRIELATSRHYLPESKTFKDE